jgi:hypothetical protein
MIFAREDSLLRVETGGIRKLVVHRNGVSPESDLVSSRTANQRARFWCFAETPPQNKW